MADVAERRKSYQWIKFRRDSTGYDPDAKPESADDAPAVLAAVDAWERGLAKLFDGCDRGMELAVSSRVLGASPSWPVAAEHRERVREWLRAIGIVGAAAAAPDQPVSTASHVAGGAGQPDRRVLEALRTLRDFLGMVGQWAEPFRLAVATASAAAPFVEMRDPSQQRAEAFAALKAVFGITSNDEPDDVSEILSNGLSTEDARSVLQQPLSLGFSAARRPFDTSPLELVPWIEQEVVHIALLLGERNKSSNPGVSDYWARWQPERRGAERNVVRKDSAPVDLLDLVMAVGTGGIPLLPLRARRTTAAEWSRLLLFVIGGSRGERADDPTLQMFAAEALEALNLDPFAEAFGTYFVRSETERPVTRDGGYAGRRERLPVLDVVIASAQTSSVCGWYPDPGRAHLVVATDWRLGPLGAPEERAAAELREGIDRLLYRMGRSVDSPQREFARVYLDVLLEGNAFSEIRRRYGAEPYVVFSFGQSSGLPQHVAEPRSLAQLVATWLDTYRAWIKVNTIDPELGRTSFAHVLARLDSGPGFVRPLAGMARQLIRTGRSLVRVVRSLLGMRLH